VVPRGIAPTVLETARRRAAAEEKKRQLYASGRLSLDVNQMRDRLREKGLIYE
jgi:4-hydroxy-4-methyl-2-oxoglutarate aldolase